MSLLHDRPKVSDVPPAEADVLIEEARRRHRRRRRVTVILAAAAAAAAVAVATAGLVYGISGNGGTERHSAVQNGSSSRSVGSVQRSSSGVISDPVSIGQGLGMATSSTEWVASGGGVLFSTDQGAHWRKVTPPVQNDIEDVTGYGRNDLWIAIHYGPHFGAVLVRSTDGGRTWTDLNPQRCLGEMVPDGTCSFDYPSLTFVSPEVGFAISGAVGAAGDTNGSAFYRTTNGGSTWTVIANTCASGPIQFVNQLDGWTLAPAPRSAAPLSQNPPACPSGPPNSQQMELEHTTDGGVGWHAVIPTGQQAASFSSPYFFNASDGVVGALMSGSTPSAQVFDIDSTTDGGATWTVHRVPITPFGTPPSLFPITPTSWAVASDAVVAGLSRIASTADGGAHWSTVLPWAKFTGARNVVFSSLRDGLAELSGTSTTRFDYPEWLYRTTDGGKTWRVVPTSTVTNADTARASTQGA